MQKIVLVGGGSGISPLLAEFARHEISVTAVVTVFDNGGSTGILRREFDIPAVGDLRKNVSATAGALGQFFEKRDGQHALGNLVLADLIRENGFKKATKIFSAFGAIEVVPVSFSNSQIVGTFENGNKIIGEEKFDHASKELANHKIKKIALEPRAKLNPAVPKLFAAADKIVVGPGSLFGSLLVNFAVTGFKQAFAKSRAQKIFVMHASEQFGCRGESVEAIVKRFGVDFDEVLPTRKWHPRGLAKRILA
ncbi:MAG: 2-phospho-L-lactate transferase CofD family protein [Patescibacteria group bacterium]|jgi:uncharacterized cofD-like protein